MNRRIRRDEQEDQKRNRRTIRYKQEGQKR